MPDNDMETRIAALEVGLTSLQSQVQAATGALEDDIQSVDHRSSELDGRVNKLENKARTREGEDAINKTTPSVPQGEVTSTAGAVTTLALTPYDTPLLDRLRELADTWCARAGGKEYARQLREVIDGQAR